VGDGVAIEGSTELLNDSWSTVHVVLERLKMYFLKNNNVFSNFATFS
jgi:hypothetical protein